MSKLTLNPTEMGAAATALQTASETYTRIYTKLLAVATEMGSAWESADNAAFVNQISGCADDLKAMADKLALASQVIEGMKKNYVAVQENNMTQVRKLAN